MTHINLIMQSSVSFELVAIAYSNHIYSLCRAHIYDARKQKKMEFFGWSRTGAQFDDSASSWQLHQSLAIII